MRVRSLRTSPHNPAKAGREAGEPVGLPPVGLTTTTELDEALASNEAGLVTGSLVTADGGFTINANAIAGR